MEELACLDCDCVAVLCFHDRFQLPAGSGGVRKGARHPVGTRPQVEER